jgi:hypothetical protein
MRALIVWAGVVILACLTAFVAERARKPLAAWIRPPADPAVSYPTDLSLGDHEAGERLSVPFAIANKGSGELIIDQVGSNCSCTGMEIEEHGVFRRVEVLRIPPAESRELVMRISVRSALLGREMISIVRFRTNDPLHPNGRITATVQRVIGGLSVTPGGVLVGSITVGQAVRRIITVRDRSPVPRVIERVSSTQRDRVSVRLLPENHLAVTDELPADGKIIGRIEVTVNSMSPGPINSEVQIELRREPLVPHIAIDSVVVAGHVVSPIEAMPSLIALPRAGESGLVFEVEVLVRSTLGLPVSVDGNGASGAFSVEANDTDNDSSKVLRIKWNRNSETGRLGELGDAIRLPLVVGGEQFGFELPILDLRKLR